VQRRRLYWSLRLKDGDKVDKGWLRASTTSPARRSSKRDCCDLRPKTVPTFDQRVLGPEHRRTLTKRMNLASFTGEAGDVAGACEQLVALLAVTERALGSDHPNTVTTSQNLAYWAEASLG
jgi:hypothetical protein